MSADPREPSPGLFQSARTLLASVVGLAHTRLELVSAELQEELARLAYILLWALVALFFVAIGVVFVAGSIMIAMWDTHRLATAIVLAVVFLALGALAALAAQRLLHAKRRIFDATLNELAKDYRDLKPRA